jgi:hypothetical protein
MKTKLALAGSITLLAASLGQAAAGPRITDKSYGPTKSGSPATGYAVHTAGQVAFANAGHRNRRVPKRAAHIRAVQRAIYGRAVSRATIVHVSVKL